MPPVSQDYAPLGTSSPAVALVCLFGHVAGLDSDVPVRDASSVPMLAVPMCSGGLEKTIRNLKPRQTWLYQIGDGYTASIH